MTEEMSKHTLALPFHSNIAEADVRLVVRELARNAPAARLG